VTAGQWQQARSVQHGRRWCRAEHLNVPCLFTTFLLLSPLLTTFPPICLPLSVAAGECQQTRSVRQTLAHRAPALQLLNNGICIDNPPIYPLCDCRRVSTNSLHSAQPMPAHRAPALLLLRLPLCPPTAASTHTPSGTRTLQVGVFVVCVDSCVEC
jgi:hypothetical protein